MKTIIAMLCVWFMAVAMMDGNNDDITAESVDTSCYSQGVNDALQAIMLLDLELKVKGERKTWGEMDEIVRKRLKVGGK